MVLTILLEISDLCHPNGLNGISLNVAAGEVVALVGSQGNGKAPLLQLLTGIGRPSHGRIHICGHAPGTPAAAARLGVAGPAWGLNPAHTVSETLSLYASLWSRPQSRAAEVAARLELTAQRDRLVADLSPGEAARLRLARALVHAPALLVLDEPMGDVDLESAEVIEGTVGAEAERGTGVLLATFGHPRTLRLADRIYYLENGRFVEPDPEPRPATEEAVGPVGAPDQPAAEARQVQVRVDQIAARRDERVVLFSPAEILYAYAQEKSVYLHTDEGDWLVSFTLSQLEERLAAHGFYRAHRGYLVNLACVREIAAWTRSSYSLRLKDGSEVPLSKHRVGELKALLGW